MSILPMEEAKASFEQISTVVLSQASSDPMVATVVTLSTQVVSDDGGEEIVGLEVMVTVPESSNLDIEGGDDCAYKFFKWLDINTCTRDTATTTIVITKFRQLEHKVELANEKLKQARAMGEAALEREQAAKRRAKRAKVAHSISEEKAEKFKIVLVISWVMFGVMLILSTRFGDVRSRQRCLPG
ncbi:hypothetical protein SO802_014941 [Lithocarpus litseifolius]|uniref:Uncharacterized protein n=1 Tax=Lithocarpus litseifolius TaxID=425828 RepID=A0AAW2CVK8_9ROSI